MYVSDNWVVICAVRLNGWEASVIRCCYEAVLLPIIVFFFKQKTAYELRISDWSSDVCSSDLSIGQGNSGGVLCPPYTRNASCSQCIRSCSGTGGPASLPGRLGPDERSSCFWRPIIHGVRT